MRTERSIAIAIPVASLLCAWLVWSGQEEPLPTLVAAAAFLFLATLTDVRFMRIPNWLTFSAFGIALAGSAAIGGLSGLLGSLAGAAAAFGLLLAPYAARCLGAGDVKAVMVLGALWGPGRVAEALLWMIAIGGVFAIAWLIYKGGVGDLLCRWRDSLVCTLASRRPVYLAPAANSAAASGLPFAVSMTLGAAAYFTWGTPWL